MNIRALATQALTPLLQQRGSLRTTLPSLLPLCEDKDRALLRQLCFGTARFYPRLELIADLLLERPIRQKELALKALLLVGLYQLLETRIPAHAAISETVQAAHQLNLSKGAGLINAVLRRFQREQDSIIEQLYTDIVYRFNHPQWFIQKLQHNWPDFWQTILTENNHQAPMALRVNQLHVSRETYQQRLAELDIEAHPSRLVDSGLILELPIDAYALPGFSQGDVSVQDEAAQLSAHLLNPQPGERILDACSAPGGKLCHLYEHSPNSQLYAVEIEPARAEKIRENLTRIQANATLHIGDATTKDWWDGQPYDRILLDAPCSASGVIRRNPDIKITRSAESIHALNELQWRLLLSAWSILRPGGSLLYATCSVFPQENSRLISRFIEQQPDAQHDPILASWGVEQPCGRQLFPQSHSHDGFYYARLKKLP